jgi:hypothetical protein
VSPCRPPKESKPVRPCGRGETGASQCYVLRGSAAAHIAARPHSRLRRSSPRRGPHPGQDLFRAYLKTTEWTGSARPVAGAKPIYERRGKPFRCPSVRRRGFPACGGEARSLRACKAQRHGLCSSFTRTSLRWLRAGKDGTAVSVGRSRRYVDLARLLRYSSILRPLASIKRLNYCMSLWPK